MLSSETNSLAGEKLETNEKNSHLVIKEMHEKVYATPTPGNEINDTYFILIIMSCSSLTPISTVPYQLKSGQTSAVTLVKGYCSI